MSDLSLDPFRDDDDDDDVASNNGSEASSSQDKFESISMYFDACEFILMPTIEKKSYLAQKERYDYCKENGHPIPLPNFMKLYAEKLIKQKSNNKAAGNKRKSAFDSSSSSGQTRKSARSKCNSAARGKENINPNNELGSGSGIASLVTPVRLASRQNKNAAASSGASNIAASQPSFSSIFRMDRNFSVFKESQSVTSFASCSQDDAGNNNDDTINGDQNQVLELEEEEESINLSGVILETVKSTLPTLPERTVDDIIRLIIDKGAEKVDHLAQTEVEWLVSVGVKHIQAKVLVNAFKKLSAEEQQQGGQKKKRKQPLPLMREQQEAEPISSRPLLASKRLATQGALGLEIDFGKFNDSLLLSLEKLQRPSSTDRLHMVQVISSDIRDLWNTVKTNNPTLKQKTPGRSVYKAIVNALFLEYEFAFQDTLNGRPQADGKYSLLDQIETCVENKYRSQSARTARALPARGNRAAACILPTKYAPPMSKQDRAEAETSRLSLLAIYDEDTDRDWDAIRSELLKDVSLAAQRALITAKTRDICLIAEKWPFLFEFPGLIAHLDNITGANLKQNFEVFITNGLDILIEFLRIMSPQRIKILKIDKQLELAGNGVQKRLFALIMMLVVHWGEDTAQFFSCVEEFTQPHEVADLLPDMPTTPHIVAVGPSPFEARKFYLMMERQCVCKELQNSLEALMAMCASFFIFGVLYPPQLSITLTFVERMLANLVDADGMNKAQTEKGCTRSCVAKLKRLEEQVAQYEKEVQEVENC